MPHPLDLTGLKVGRLTVISQSKFRDSFGNKIYLCQCDCGIKKYIRSGALNKKTKPTRSCGCILKETCHKYLGLSSRRTLNPKAPLNALFSQYRRNAKKRNIDFALNKISFQKLITSDCYFCNSSPSNKQTYDKKGRKPQHKGLIYSGIDRYNNNLGYTEENCVSCCIVCNRAKNNMTQLEWLSWLKSIARKYAA